MLEPWGVLVRLDGGPGVRAPTAYFERLDAARRGEYYDDEHGGLYKSYNEAQLRSFFLNAYDGPVLPENADGENYRYNWGQVMLSQFGTGVLDPETESIAQDEAIAQEQGDDEEDGEEDDDEDSSGGSEALVARLLAAGLQG